MVIPSGKPSENIGPENVFSNICVDVCITARASDNKAFSRFCLFAELMAHRNFIDYQQLETALEHLKESYT